MDRQIPAVESAELGNELAATRECATGSIRTLSKKSRCGAPHGSSRLVIGSLCAFVKWLVAHGLLERPLAERYWRRTGAPSGQFDVAGTSVALTAEALVELDENGILAPVLERGKVTLHD